MFSLFGVCCFIVSWESDVMSYSIVQSFFEKLNKNKAENPLMRNCVSVYVKPIRHPYAFYVAPLTRIFTHVKKFSQ